MLPLESLAPCSCCNLQSMCRRRNLLRLQLLLQLFQQYAHYSERCFMLQLINMYDAPPLLRLLLVLQVWWA